MLWISGLQSGIVGMDELRTLGMGGVIYQEQCHGTLRGTGPSMDNGGYSGGALTWPWRLGCRTCDCFLVELGWLHVGRVMPSLDCLIGHHII